MPRINSYTKKAVARYVAPKIYARLSDHQLKALYNFAQDIGLIEFRSSKFLGLMNQGKLDEAADEMERWVYELDSDGTARLNPELKARREAQSTLLMTAREKDGIGYAPLVLLAFASLVGLGSLAYAFYG